MNLLCKYRIFIAGVALTVPLLSAYADDDDKKPIIMNIDTGKPCPEVPRSNPDPLGEGATLMQPDLHFEPVTAKEEPMGAPFIDDDIDLSHASISFSRVSMPASFRGTRPNQLYGGECLTPFFMKLASGKSVKVLQIGDSHVRGNYFPLAIREMLYDTFNKEKKTVTFDYIGINGAQASKFAGADMLRTIASKKADLIIISFGTNEAHGNFVASSHTRILQSLTDGIRRSQPDVQILLTTPPGSHIARGGSGKVPNRVNGNVADNIIAFGRNQNIAVWDLYHIVGGNDNACTNWTRARLMQADKVHYTATGYKLMGRLLTEALLKAYVRSVR